MRRHAKAVLLAACISGVVLPASSEPHRTVYVVRSGDTLGRIADRYGTSIAAICRANALNRRDLIRPGQRMVIPATRNPEESVPRRRPAKEVLSTRSSRASVRRDAPDLELSPGMWQSLVRPPERSGWVRVRTQTRSWEGSVDLAGGPIREPTRRAFEHVLFDRRTGEEGEIAGRLIRILARTSETFGGRTLRVASGYRQQSFAKESRHRHGAACDFSVDGVPNLALFAYLETLPHVGIGYYPNSSFVHLDVRPKKAIWVDLSGPGEAPEYVDPVWFFKERFAGRPVLEN